MFAKRHPPTRRRQQGGLSSLEVIVSLTLLGSVLALSTPLIVAHGRLLKAQRNYRLALDELSNQIDRMSALPTANLPRAIDEIAPSALAAERLPGAVLRGRLAEAELGWRLTLEIWWEEPNRQAAPVRMTAWVVPPTGPADRTQE
jgi:hypothetical protein